MTGFTQIRMTGVTQIPLTRLKTTRPNAGQHGFALLLVLLMAAAVAFSLYLEMPRVGFESARNREQLLMDRGGQFKRAIEVYYAVNKKYPATLEDLEKASDKRFLRHRYKDPLTGNDEWRLIHTNGSFLTDSLVKKPPVQNAQNGLPANQNVGAGPLGANSLNTIATGVGSNAAAGSGVDPNNSNPTGQPAPRNAAALRRPSDLTGRPQVFDQNNNQNGNPFDPNQQSQGFTGFNPPNYNPNDPSTWPPITLAPAGQQPAGQQFAGQRPLQQFGAAGNPFGAAQYNPQINGPNGQDNQFNGQQPGLSNQGFPNQGFPNQGFQNQGLQNQGFPNQGFPNQGNNQPVVIPGFGGQPQTGGVLNIQNAPLGGQLNGQPLGFGQDNSAGASQQVGIPGQFPGFGGANPQPNPFATGNTLNNQGTSPAQQAAALAQQQGFSQNQNPAAALASAFPGQGGSQQNFNQQSSNQQNFNQQSFNQQNFNAQTVGAGFPSTTPQFPVTGAGNLQQQGANNNNAALNAINQTLLGGQNGLQGAGGNLGSPGIAGVASKFEGPSIKSYGDRTKYQEWEFVFDPAAKLPAGQLPQANPLQNQGNQQNPANPPGPFGGSNPFGQPNSPGQPNPFAQQPGQQPGQQPQGNTQSPFPGLFGPGR